MKKIFLATNLFLSLAFSAWAGTAGVEFQSDTFLNPKTHTFESEEIKFKYPMNRAVLSWNALTPKNSFIVVSLRTKISEQSWSPWLVMGKWGTGIESTSVKNIPHDLTLVDQDTFKAKNASTTWKYKIEFFKSSDNQNPTVYSVSLAAKNADRYTKTSNINTPSPPLPSANLSQFEGGKAIGFPDDANRICSPTSLAMLLAFELSNPQPLDLLKTCVIGVKDRAGAIPYGNWSFNVAFMFHHLKSAEPENSWKTYARWYESLNDVLAHIQQGHPVIVNIQYKNGELQGAAIPSTAGHLVLVTGADPTHIYVRDPAAELSEQVPRKYLHREFISAWKGLAYVVEKQP